MTYIVGVTGGIGSGKSTVARLFADKGIEVVDTDDISHELTGPEGLAMAAIAKEFGPQVLRRDGALDRATMRSLVFSDLSAKARLENILHPLIRAESMGRCEAARSAYVLLMVPLLVESGAYRARCDRVLVVDCREETQVSRVTRRNGLAPEAVRAIMTVQATRAERLAAADDVVDNELGLASLAPQVEVLHARYLELAALKLQKAG